MTLETGSGADTLSAVVIGAVLATVGGFIATQLETIMRRREREHSAALLFGEILSVVELLMDLTARARSIGEPYGPLTLRLVRAMAREIDIYERNREVLYELRDSGVRARLHTAVVRMRAALDGIIDFSTSIGEADLTLMGMAQDHPARAEMAARIADLTERRDASFEFAVDAAARIKPILSALQPIARQSFEAHAAIAREV